jgi:hypothetical protein
LTNFIICRLCQILLNVGIEDNNIRGPEEIWESNTSGCLHNLMRGGQMKDPGVDWKAVRLL